MPRVKFLRQSTGDYGTKHPGEFAELSEWLADHLGSMGTVIILPPEMPQPAIEPVAQVSIEKLLADIRARARLNYETKVIEPEPAVAPMIEAEAEPEPPPPEQPVAQAIPRRRGRPPKIR